MPDLFNLKRWRYLISGLTGRIGRPRRCPVCASASGKRLDRKFFHRLFECQGCGILYRYPNETKEQMEAFYQSEYVQEGLTTSLPPEPELRRLLETNFSGTDKDASRVSAALKALGLGPGARVLDYGASWGYASVQLKRAGFDVESFELSRPRAALGERIGVRIESDLEKAGHDFDAVYSGHVLEHTPNPLHVLGWMTARCRPGGFVLAFTPSGCEAHRQKDFAAMHAHWGFKHPVMLTERFIIQNFGGLPYYISTSDSAEVLSNWDGKTPCLGNLEGDELFFVLRPNATT